MRLGTNLPIPGVPNRRSVSAEASRRRRFAWFLTSWGLGELGYSVYSIAAIWIAYRVSGSAAGAGAVVGLEYGAYALIPLVGPVIDRLADGRRLLLLCYPLQGGVAITLGVVATTGHLTLPLVLVGVGVISFLWNFVWTLNSIAPALLVHRDDLFRAQSRSQLVGAGASLAGFAVGGVAVSLAPVLGIFLYGLFLFAAAIPVLAFALPLGRRPPAASLWADFRDGWRQFLRVGQRGLLHLSVVDAVGAVFAVAPLLLITVVAAHPGRGGAQLFAILFVAYIAGGGVVGLGFARLSLGRRVGRFVTVSLALAGLLVALSPLAESAWWIAAGLWFIVGAALEGYGSLFQVYLQSSSPVEVRGRLVANAYLFSSVGSSAGAVVLTLTLLGGGPVLLAVLAGGGLLFAGLLGWLLPSVRRLVTTSDEGASVPEPLGRAE